MATALPCPRHPRVASSIPDRCASPWQRPKTCKSCVPCWIAAGSSSCARRRGAGAARSARRAGTGGCAPRSGTWASAGRRTPRRSFRARGQPGIARPASTARSDRSPGHTPPASMRRSRAHTSTRTAPRPDRAAAAPTPSVMGNLSRTLARLRRLLKAGVVIVTSRLMPRNVSHRRSSRSLRARSSKMKPVPKASRTFFQQRCRRTSISAVPTESAATNSSVSVIGEPHVCRREPPKTPRLRRCLPSAKTTPRRSHPS